MTWDWKHNKNKIINYCKLLPYSKGFWICVIYYIVVLIVWLIIGE